MKSRDQVAPIVIKDCREEFQRLSKFKDPIVKGRMADGLPLHPLIKVHPRRADVTFPNKDGHTYMV